MNKKLLIIASVSLLALQFSLASAASAQTLGNKLKGKILLQVESHGEAWYVNPADGKRYFLARPQDAFNIMRKLGTGIKCSDLNKITPSKDHNIDTTAGNDSESNLNNNTGDNNDNSYNYSDDNSSGDSSQSGQEKPNYKTASKLTTITFSRVITGPYNTYNNAGARNQSVSLKITGYLKEIDPDANEFTRYGDKGYDFDQGAVEWTIDELENDGNTTGCNYITSAAGSGKDSIANLDVPYDTNNGKDSNGNIAHLSSFDLKLKYVNTGLTGKSELSIAGSLLIPIDVTETVIHGKSNLICGSTTQTTAVSRKDAAVAAFPLKLLKTGTGASLKGSLSAYETSNYFNNTSNIVSGTTDAQFGIPVFTGEGAYDIDSAPWNVTWEIEFPE